MAVTFQSYQFNRSSSGSVAVDKPTNLAINDLMIAHVVVDSPTANITPPTGFLVIGSEDRAGANFKSTLFYKLATASDVAAANFTFSKDDGSYITCALSRITGPNITAPITASTGQANTASTTATSGGLTPSASSLLLFFVSQPTSAAAVSAYATVSATTFTERYDSNGLSDTNGVAMATGTRADTTPTGNASATLASSKENVVHLVNIAIGVNVSVTAGLFSLTLRQTVVAVSKLFQLTVTMFSGTTNKWSNQQKTSATWTNQDKS